MDESTTGVPAARPFGGITIDRRISAVPAIPGPRSGSDSDSWPLGPSRPMDGPGGRLPSEHELIERTLAFAGSYVSDDGHLAIRRSAGSFGHSRHRFLGYCGSCARARLIQPTGEPLPDVVAAIRFITTHDHDEVD
jgi:hypothetical protein